jgi:hypothetical protein
MTVLAPYGFRADGSGTDDRDEEEEEGATGEDSASGRT